MSERDGLTIKDIEERTGVHASTLRIWELRHAFPEPRRLVSGHRRYSEHDCTLVRRVVELRGAGLSLGAAIERARSTQSHPEPSIYGALRRMRPDIPTHTLSKRALVAISHAIEDECATRPHNHLLLGAFQTERSYRQAEARWRDMSRQAELSVVFLPTRAAETPTSPHASAVDSQPRPVKTAAARSLPEAGSAPVEVASDTWDPAQREWLVLCDTDGCHACLAGWERPGQGALTDAQRRFEVVWTLDPSAVREAVRLLAARVAQPAAALAGALRARADEMPSTPTEELRIAGAMMGRMLAYLSAAGDTAGVKAGERPRAAGPAPAGQPGASAAEGNSP